MWPRLQIFDVSWKLDGDDGVEVETTLAGDGGDAVPPRALRLTLYASGTLPVDAASAARKERGPVVAEAEESDVRGRLGASDDAKVFEDVEDGRGSSATVVSVLRADRRLKLWHPDRPFLYTLVVELLDEHDATLQAEACYVGAKTVAVGADGVLRVNGSRLSVAGVNRHETCPARGGPHVSREDAEKDVILMKSGHFNCVRCSHYPQSPAFYAACDRGGLLVVDEANVETHGYAPYPGYLADQAHWRDAYFRRVQRMVLRDRCHPSIFAWSLGNEAGYGGVHDDLCDWVRRVDPSRVVQYEPASWACYEADAAEPPRPGAPKAKGSTKDPRATDPHSWHACAFREPPARRERLETRLGTDVLCPMYARLDECAALLRQDAAAFDVLRPLILCEYAHAMGNSCGNLDEYWAAFRDPEVPRLQGGFVWDLADQGLKKRLGATTFWAYGGDFGELPTDETFCLNGLVFPDRALKPTWLEAAAVQRPFEDPDVVAVERGDRFATLVVRVGSRGPKTGVGLATRFLFAWRLECDGVVLAQSQRPQVADAETPREARTDARRIKALEVGPGARLRCAVHNKALKARRVRGALASTGATTLGS